MSSMRSCASRPGAAGATTLVSTPSFRSAIARRSTNEPGASPGSRGYECVRNRTFIVSAFFDTFGAEVVELATDLAELRALAGDLFAEQSRREENAAEDEARG